jgi:hypothetical protein
MPLSAAIPGVAFQVCSSPEPRARRGNPDLLPWYRRGRPQRATPVRTPGHRRGGLGDPRARNPRERASDAGAMAGPRRNDLFQPNPDFAEQQPEAGGDNAARFQAVDTPGELSSGRTQERR